MREEVSNKKKNKTRNAGAEMSFWEHLDALRWHLFRAVVAVLVLALLAFLNKKIIFDSIILGPKDPDFITTVLLCRLSEWIGSSALCMDMLQLELQNLKMPGQFLIHIYVSIIGGAIVASPYVFWEIWSFLRPALSSKEKKYSWGAVFVCSFLFLAGVFFSYFVIVPLTVYFFGTYQISETVQNSIALDSYIKTVVSLTFAVGLVFELPVLIYFLTKVGVVSPTFLKKNRKIVLVLILILSAIITPPDVFSQILVGIPLFGLYEISIRVSSRIHKKNLAEKETS